ncbi:MAG: hypothetical protein FWF15_01490 [Oscillospiraceae bacterium]|nr:hypothetical protein [Oscillospiraceae bacterium]
MKKFITFTFLFALIFLYACSSDTVSKTEGPKLSDDDSVTDTDTTAVLPPVFPDITFDGKTVLILGDDLFNERYWLTVETENGDILNDTVYRRNSKIGEMFDVTFVCKDGGGSANILMKSLMAGETAYDLYLPHPNTGIPELISNKALQNIYDLEYTDLSKPWWNAAATEEYTVNGKLFMPISEYTITYQGFSAILFNKNYIDDFDMKIDLYGEVFKGTWTYDKFYGAISNISADLDGDGVMTADDRWGMTLHQGYAWGFSYAHGQKITTRDADGYPILDLNTERMMTVVERLYNLAYNGMAYTATSNNAGFPTNPLWTIFKNGNAFLTTLDIGAMFFLMRDLEFDVGILPWPKYEETQEKYMSSTASGFFCIPSMVENQLLSDILFEALSYYSYLDLKPAFFEKVLEGKITRDPESYQILEMLHLGKTYDIGFTIGNANAQGFISNIVFTKKSTDLASHYASVESEIVNFYGKAFDVFFE